MGGSYLSNGCYYCNSLQGNFYLASAFAETGYDFSQVVSSVDIKWADAYSYEELEAITTWRFRKD